MCAATALSTAFAKSDAMYITATDTLPTWGRTQPKGVHGAQACIMEERKVPTERAK